MGKLKSGQTYLKANPPSDKGTHPLRKAELSQPYRSHLTIMLAIKFSHELQSEVQAITILPLLICRAFLSHHSLSIIKFSG